MSWTISNYCKRIPFIFRPKQSDCKDYYKFRPIIDLLYKLSITQGMECHDMGHVIWIEVGYTQPDITSRHVKLLCNYL